MNWANSLQADTNSERLKMPWIIIGWVWSKMCVGYLGNGILKSALSQEWIDELSWFLHADTNSGNLKVTLMFILWAWPNMDMVF